MPSCCAGVGKIGLAQHDAVGDRRLLDRLCMGVERCLAVDGIDHGHDAVEPVAQQQIGMRHQRVQHRRRIGEAGGFQQHAAERAAPVVEVAQQRFQRVDQIAAHGAAQAARLAAAPCCRRYIRPAGGRGATSPNSLMMTAVSASAGSFSRRLSSVVLPAPRKPVSTVSGIGSAGRRRSALSAPRRSLCAEPTFGLVFFLARLGLRRLAGSACRLWPWRPARFRRRPSPWRLAFSSARAARGLRRVRMIGRPGENDDRRLGIDRRTEHEFAVGRLQAREHEGLRRCRTSPLRGAPAAAVALLPRCPPTAACADDRRTFPRAGSAAARRSAPARRRCRATASARTGRRC